MHWFLSFFLSFFLFCCQLNRSDSDSSTLAKKSLFVRNSTERRSLRVKRVCSPLAASRGPGPPGVGRVRCRTPGPRGVLAPCSWAVGWNHCNRGDTNVMSVLEKDVLETAHSPLGWNLWYWRIGSVWSVDGEKAAWGLGASWPLGVSGISAASHWLWSSCGESVTPGTLCERQTSG